MTHILHNDAYQLFMLYSHWKNNRADTIATAEAFFRKVPSPLGTQEVIMSGAYRIAELMDAVASSLVDITVEDLRQLMPDEVSLREDLVDFHEWLLTKFHTSLRQVEVLCAPDSSHLYFDFPAVQVTGPIGWVHLLETPILSILNSSVRTASIARRIVHSTPASVSLLEFGSRRTHEEAAVHTAVDAIVGGFSYTSNLAAGKKYGAPVSGTMAHSFVMSYGVGRELDAFKEYLSAFPFSHSLLIDTYDIRTGLLRAIRASFETGIPLRSVRIDSGDPLQVVPFVRDLLDGVGLGGTRIILSGDFDEEKIAKLFAKSVSFPVDGIGVGSRISSPDFSMGFVYKLVEVNGQPVIKLSGNKSSLPGKKVWARKDTAAILTFEGDELLEGSVPMLCPLPKEKLELTSHRNHLFKGTECTSFQKKRVMDLYHETIQRHKESVDPPVFMGVHLVTGVSDG